MIRRRFAAGAEDRARGALLGLAVGDALGAALEWLSPDQIAARYGGPLRDMVASQTWKRGEWTDDTAMALQLAESLDERDGFDLDDVFARYAVWARGGPKDIGTTVASSLLHARTAAGAQAAAVEWHRRSGGMTAGNGSLMRTVPIALRYARDRERLVDASRRDSALTHHDPLAADACVWLNEVVAALVRGREPPALAGQAADAAASARVTPPDRLLAEAHSALGFVLTALRVGAHAAFEHDGFEPAIVFAANLGGDADTNAAVAGALAGARFGAAAIPQRWLEPLRERDRIAGLAERLLARA
ncbi:MAG TPA: ADP-ribosylglycohydrolase family protein [Gaiellales bacterium]|nr:ADP-ribosylglycohydrolase family protein [Gaiellales bacterium]